MAMVWRAWLRCRSPVRLRRCLVVLPEEAGRGLVPAILAKAASEWMRPGWDQAVRMMAAVMGPMPGWSSRWGAAWATMVRIWVLLVLRSVSRVWMCLARRVASARAVAVPRGSLRVRQVAIWVI